MLVEAIASGKPVVATRFPHAIELLVEGSGILVPHEDQEAIAAALAPSLPTRRSPGARQPPPPADRHRRIVGRPSAALTPACGRGRGHPREGGELRLPSPSFSHLLRLSDEVGVFEHALCATPRVDHGYCTDDAARALIVIVREQRPAELRRLEATYLSFLERAQLPDGRFHNRLSPPPERRWLDEVGSDDANGRAVWALGIAAAHATTEPLRRRGLTRFQAGAGLRSRAPRTNAYAVLGAVEVLSARPRDTAAGSLLEVAASRLGSLSPDPDWPWPEARLAYDNARLAEARIAAGVALGDQGLLDEGLCLLDWLVEVETCGDHFSFTPVGGRGRGERHPAFDQQPIEAGAMTDACARALDATGEERWAAACLRAAAWFVGANDVGVPLLDSATGGCSDGLEAGGCSANQGAESTLAMIGALQQASQASSGST